MKNIYFNEDYMSPKEVASALGLSHRTLSRWHRLRKGPRRIKVGRKVFYRRTAVQLWMSDNEE